jgi:dTDP-4-dehydrorhamnose reductase
MRVLVLGGGGQIARAVAATAPARHEVVLKTRAQLDIGDAAGVARALAESRADWIVNGAAYTAVDLAEDQPEQAIAANNTAVGILAAAAGQTGCRLLHLSTDFVFDGKSNSAYQPNDRTNPLSVYGMSKLGGERQVLNADAGGIVLRTAWVYAAAGRNFVLTMLRLMAEKPEVRVVSDQIGAPTWAGSVAAAVWGLIETDAPGGIYHWTDLGVASWYDFAVAVQEEAQLNGLLDRAVPVVPIRSAEYPTVAQRPAFSLLDARSTRAMLKLPEHHWRHNLRIMLEELRASQSVR